MKKFKTRPSTLFSIPTIILFVIFLSCREEVAHLKKNITTVKVNVLLEDSLLNVRAMEVAPPNIGVFATSNGKVGFITSEIPIMPNVNTTSVTATIANNLIFKEDTIVPNFRSLAITNKGLFVLGIGSPALLFKVDSTNTLKLVYKEDDPKAFYDSIEFWNDDEGIAIGDPVQDCMSIIVTGDGGNSWKKVDCSKLPKSEEGEAAFAASDSNIAIVGDEIWIATGGVASRVLYSPDKGESWGVKKTPIIQGKSMQGIFSIDFYDSLHGFAIGGDFEDPDNNKANKIKTSDGGMTWKLVAEGEGPGYRSYITYVPGRSKELVAIGFKGIDYSKDEGSTWQHLSDEGFYTLRFLNDSVAYAGGKGRVAELIFSRK